MLERHLQLLPKFCLTAILSGVTRSLSFRMIDLAVQLMKTNGSTASLRFDESRNVDISHIEKSLDELKEIRAAFADATFAVNPYARVGFDEIIDDKLGGFNRDNEVKLFRSFNTGLIESEIREIFRDYDARHLSRDTRDTVLSILRSYDTVGFDIDKSFLSVSIDIRRRVLKALIRTLERRQSLLDFENPTSPAWVNRINPLERFKELKCITKSIDGLQNLYSDISAS